MHTPSKPRLTRTPAERQVRKLEQQIEGEKAYAEYRARNTAALANMRRLRTLRLAGQDRPQNKMSLAR
jgi:hypothetical protein